MIQLILILVILPLVLGASAALIYIFLVSRSYLGLAIGFLATLAILSLVTAVNLTFISERIICFLFSGRLVQSFLLSLVP